MQEPSCKSKPVLVQFSCSVMSNSLHGLQELTPWTAACQAFLSITNSRSLPKLMSIESVMPSNHLLLCHPLLLLPSIFPSIRAFSNESVLHIRWPKYWSFSFSIHPSNEYSGLISFRMDWLNLLAVQGTLKNLLQHHSSKALILQHSAFFLVQRSHPYMTYIYHIYLCLFCLIITLHGLITPTLLYQLGCFGQTLYIRVLQRNRQCVSKERFNLMNWLMQL